MIRLMPSHAIIGGTSGLFQRACMMEGRNAHPVEDILNFVHAAIMRLSDTEHRAVS